MLRGLARPLLKRLLLTIPSLLVLTLIAFYASTHLPGEAIQQLANSETISSDPKSEARLRKQIRHEQGLDLPLFYFSITGLGDCDTLMRIHDDDIRRDAARLNTLTGRWTSLEQSYVNTLLKRSLETNDTARQQLTILENDIYHKCIQEKQVWKRYIPLVHFYRNNQYHRFLFGDNKKNKGYLRFDMGHSLRTGEAVSKRIFSTLKISISISLVAIFLAYLFSIPLAVHSVLYPNSKRSKALVLLQFILPALPSFFVAGLLLFLFANPSILSIFPASGIAPINAKSFLDSLPYLVLPIIAFSYTHITFVSKTVQTKIREALQMPFASFLRDNGVSEKRIAYRYALPLSYIPLLQLLAHAIPASIAGAVIIENIFSIPGMGSLLFESIATHDYPITVGIFTLIAISTLLAYVISDILAMILDRRLMR